MGLRSPEAQSRRKVGVRRPRVYYGWWIVTVSFLSLCLTFPLKMYTFGIFMKPMAEEMNWSRASTTGALSLSLLLAGLMGPLVGRVVDSHGPRLIMATGVVIGGCSLALLSRVDELWQFYVVFGIVYTIGETMMGSVAATTVVSNWFIRRRGTALGITSTAIGVGGMTLVPFVTYATSSFGWRTSWILIAALQLFTLLPSILLVMRRRPEDVGLLPDGLTTLPPPSDLSAKVPRAELEEEHWTIGRALRSSNFWFMGLAYGVTSGATSTFAIHVIPFATDAGISVAAAAAAISLLHAIALPGRVFYGWLADKIPKRLIIFFLQAVLAICFLIMSQTRTEAMLYLAVLAYALVIGGQLPVNQALLAALFGRKALGTISGSVYLLGTTFNASFPVLAGFLFDVTGNYSLAFLFLVPAEALGMLALYFVRPTRAALPESAAPTT